MRLRHRQIAHRRNRPARRRGGFTLIEAALTTVIIGTGVLAIVAGQQAYHRKNNWAQRTGTAMMLANEIRELMVYMDMREPGSTVAGPDYKEEGVADYDDVDDFVVAVDGNQVGVSAMISPPLSALGQPIADMDGWAQQIRIKRVNDDAIGATEASPTGTLMDAELVRVTADVFFEGELMSSMSWLVTPR